MRNYEFTVGEVIVDDGGLPLLFDEQRGEQVTAFRMETLREEQLPRAGLRPYWLQGGDYFIQESGPRRGRQVRFKRAEGKVWVVMEWCYPKAALVVRAESLDKLTQLPAAKRWLPCGATT